MQEKYYLSQVAQPLKYSPTHWWAIDLAIAEAKVLKYLEQTHTPSKLGNGGIIALPTTGSAQSIDLYSRKV